MGRPEKEIDWEFVDELLESGSEGVEIAGELGVHYNTFYDRVQKKYGITFTEYCEPKYSAGKAKLRRAQFEKAIGKSKKGDTTLLLHLGRTRLKQVDAQPEKVIDSSPNDIQLNYADAFIKAEADKIIMAKELEILREKINALESKANSVIHRSDEEIQHLGGSRKIREDVLQHPEAD